MFFILEQNRPATSALDIAKTRNVLEKGRIAARRSTKELAQEIIREPLSI